MTLTITLHPTLRRRASPRFVVPPRSGDERHADRIVGAVTVSVAVAALTLVVWVIVQLAPLDPSFTLAGYWATR